ncbi:unnamed protein product [Effrenium voratum]|uniref:Ion transport domain-containing protein n=1 Tax=Effrenium voratum TaxID=2562239 RepID=A0AA36I8B6_9DINO|nr:unnamed protein product [Effrenium voratum]
MSRPSSGVSRPSRPGTAAGERPRSANVQAFQRGKEAAYVEAVEICRQGLTNVSGHLLTSFHEELQSLGATLQLQVNEAMEERQRRADEKLDHLLLALQDRGRSESPRRNYFAGLAHDGGKIEANKQLVKRREEQISNMLVVLEKLEQRSAVDRSQALEQQLQLLTDKFDLMDNLLRAMAARKEEPASPRERRMLDRAESMTSVRKAPSATEEAPTPLFEAEHDVDQLYHEIKASRKLVNRNFRSTIKEISRIQQALNLDYAIASETESDGSSASAGGSHGASPAASVHVRVATVAAAATPSAPSAAPSPALSRETTPPASPAKAAAASAKPAPSAPELPSSSSVPTRHDSKVPSSRSARSLLPESRENSERGTPRPAQDENYQDTRRPSRSNRSRSREPEAERGPGGVVEAPKRIWKRVREMWTQTEIALEERGAQTDPMQRVAKKTPGFAASLFGKKEKSGDMGRKMTMNDLDTMKARARKALMKPQYDVTNFYKTEGCFQAIARSSMFDQFTVAIVSINAIWIAIDADNNDALLLYQAAPVFQVVENLFCTYFFAEVLIRFGAFAQKKRAFMDKWFVFDAVLVLNMVIETWVLPLALMAFSSEDSANTIDVSMLRMLRLVKLTRLSRVTRLLRSVPELAIIVKAIGLSARSVSVFFLLWLVLIYVFAVILRQLTQGTDFGSAFFVSVPMAMDTLLMDGILADYAPLLDAVPQGQIVEWGLLLFFVLLAAITIMYMLVGVLVEVVGALAHAEKESLTVGWVASSLRKKMESFGHDTESPLSKSELQDVLLDPDITDVLQSVQVDVVALMELVNIAYEDSEKTGNPMTFEKIVSLVLNGRGQNTACVKDTSELLRILKQTIIQRTSEATDKLQEEISTVYRTIQTMREEQFEATGGALQAFRVQDDEPEPSRRREPRDEDSKRSTQVSGRRTMNRGGSRADE